MAIFSPVPALQDLKITFQDCSLVFPSQETQKKSIFLSNIDQIVNFNVQTAHFFKPNPDFPLDNVAKRIKMALEKVLVPYDFMAGRLKLNHEIGRLEIDCNAAGAGFILAASEFSLDEIGNNLVHPNLGFQQLAVRRLDNLASEVDQPLCVFQVTSFKCGGFVIGMSTNHILFDGVGAKTFLENLASQAFDDKPLAAIPCNNRQLLAARSPPYMAFPHPEFGEGSSPPVPDCSGEELEFRIFKLSSTDIANLKDKAKSATDVNVTTTRISSFVVVAALLWQCKAFSGNIEHKKDRVSTLLHAIDIRPRVNPSLPPSYIGNAALAVRVSATLQELENGPFSELVEMISEGAKEITDEYVKSALDWLELNKPKPHRDYLVTSWLRLGFDQVVYPWGKPIYSCPVVNHRKGTCWVFPDATDGGVGAMVTLPAKEMERFEALFHKFLA